MLLQAVKRNGPRWRVAGRGTVDATESVPLCSSDFWLFGFVFHACLSVYYLSSNDLYSVDVSAKIVIFVTLVMSLSYVRV